MADIFLSYKREDREKVRPLVEALQTKGWSVWWDTRIGSGETWDRVIEEQLKAATCVLVVWSPLSIESRWVRSEAHDGLERDCLVPVIVGNARPPLAFRLVQGTDLSAWQGDRSDPDFLHVCAGIERVAGAPSVVASNAVRQQDTNTAALTAFGRGGDRDTSEAVVVERSPVADDEHAVAAETLRPSNRPPLPPSAAPRSEMAEGETSQLAAAGGPVKVAPPHAGMAAAAVSQAGETPHIKARSRGAAPYVGAAIVLLIAAVLMRYLPGVSTPMRPASPDLPRIEKSDAGPVINVTPKAGTSELASKLSKDAHAALVARDDDRALAGFNELIKLEPNSALAYNGRGIIYATRKDYDRALAEYSKAIELEPGLGMAYSNRGSVHRDRKDYDRALADYNKVIEINPRDASAYNYRGILHEDRKDIPRALADFNKAIEVDPRYAPAYNNRASLFKKRQAPGDRDRAVADYRKVLEIEPSNAYAKQSLQRLSF